jgi:arylsulfatase A-like enzyme/predicted Zn-dependent protease
MLTMKIEKRYRLLAVALLAAGLGAAIWLLLPGGRKVKRAAADFNLLVVTLDTLRADRVGAYGNKRPLTPSLDQLAGKGVLFENCYTPVPVTLPAHCSLFTGLTPPGHGVRDNGTFVLGDDAVTLAEKMKQAGRRTYALIASYVLLAKFGLGQGFDVYDDSLNIRELTTNLDSEIKADEVYSRFQNWFKRRDALPFFAWVHFYDAHASYDPPAEYRKRFGESLEDLYDGEVANADRYLGRIIDELRNSGELERTLLVVAGDHGEGFGEHGEFGHALFCYEESLRVPLVFYCPRLLPQGLRIKTRTGLLDVLPTLLELFGLDSPSGLQGKSLTGLMNGRKEADRSQYFETMHGKEELGWAPLSGLIQDSWKYISLPEAELYDINSDKFEKNNLFLNKNLLARELDGKLRQLITEYAIGSRDARHALSVVDRRHLASLGYVSAFGGNTQSGLDPKKGIVIEKRFQDIAAEVKNGRLDAAESQLQDLLKENPANRMPQYFGQLANIHLARKDREAVIRTWREAVAAFPANDFLRINLAAQLFEMKRFAAADQVAAEAVKNNPGFTQAHIMRGRIAEKENRLRAAVDHYARALELEGRNVQLKIDFARLLIEIGDNARAEACCRELLADDSVRSDLLSRAKIGHLLAECSRGEAAESLLAEVVAAGHDDAVTWNDLGNLHFFNGQFEKALGEYKKALAKDATVAKTHSNLGSVFLALALRRKDGELLKQALAAFDQALELDKRLPAAWNGRGSIFKFTGRFSAAIGAWQRAVELDPGLSDAYFNIAITYLEMNDRLQAMKYLRLCRAKCWNKLSNADRQRLERLQAEAGD